MESYKFTQNAAKIQEILNKADGLPAGAVGLAMVSTTWSELKALRDGGGLVAGTWYRITDYVTTVSVDADEKSGDVMMRSAGHPYDVLVLATSASTLSELARAIHHDGDEYFADCDLGAWRVWYCLDNDKERFGWADEESGKGVVWRLIDEHRNDCPYDFKNVQFKRYQITGMVSATAFAQENRAIVYGSLQQLINGRSDYERNLDPCTFYHLFSGYMRESAIVSAGFAESFSEYGTMTSSGTRMFCVLRDNDGDPEIIAQTSVAGKWFYTFHNASGTGGGAVDSDTSLVMNGTCDVRIGFRERTGHWLYGNVFMALARCVSLYDSYDNTFLAPVESALEDTRGSRFFTLVSSRSSMVSSSSIGAYNSELRSVDGSFLYSLDRSRIDTVTDSHVSSSFYSSIVRVEKSDFQVGLDQCSCENARWDGCVLTNRFGDFQNVQFVGGFTGEIDLEDLLDESFDGKKTAVIVSNGQSGAFKFWYLYDVHD